MIVLKPGFTLHNIGKMHDVGAIRAREQRRMGAFRMGVGSIAGEHQNLDLGHYALRRG